MDRTLTMTRLTLWVNRLIGAIVAVLLPCLPLLLNWYSSFRSLTQAEYTAILVAFYCCAVVIAIALWNIDKLLRNILKEEVFTRENVSCIRRVRWCCAGISLITLPAAFIYLPLFFLVIIMAFLSLVVCVVVRVMDAAVIIREENDLTI